MRISSKMNGDHQELILDHFTNVTAELRIFNYLDQSKMPIGHIQISKIDDYSIATRIVPFVTFQCRTGDMDRISSSMFREVWITIADGYREFLSECPQHIMFAIAWLGVNDGSDRKSPSDTAYVNKESDIILPCYLIEAQLIGTKYRLYLRPFTVEHPYLSNATSFRDYYDTLTGANGITLYFGKDAFPTSHNVSLAMKRALYETDKLVRAVYKA